jgi:hypothetical protein
VATSTVLGISSVQDTSLFKQLEKGFSSNPAASDAEHFCAVLPSISESACLRMREMATLHAEYTLHDDTHLLRVTELMARVMQDTMSRLNPVEIAILILAAHLHDQGMVLSPDELAELKQSQEFQIFRQNWEASHPNLVAIRNEASRSDLASTVKEQLNLQGAELENAIQTEFIRLTHGKRSADYIRETFETDRRLEVANVNLASAVALAC